LRNPFDALFENEPQALTPYEEVGGAMSCQRYNCDGVATEGRYYYDDLTLEYTCPHGHENRCEGISI
jgi:hypothetical protein